MRVVRADDRSTAAAKPAIEHDVLRGVELVARGAVQDVANRDGLLDGVGVGTPDPGSNPFAAARTPTLDVLAGGSWSEPTLGWTAAEVLRQYGSLEGALGAGRFAADKQSVMRSSARWPNAWAIPPEAKH